MVAVLKGLLSAKSGDFWDRFFGYVYAIIGISGMSVALFFSWFIWRTEVSTNDRYFFDHLKNYNLRTVVCDVNPRALSFVFRNKWFKYTSEADVVVRFTPEQMEAVKSFMGFVSKDEGLLERKSTDRHLRNVFHLITRLNAVHGDYLNRFINDAEKYPGVRVNLVEYVIN